MKPKSEPEAALSFPENDPTANPKQKNMPMIIVLAFGVALLGYFLTVPVAKGIFNEKDIAKEFNETLKDLNSLNIYSYGKQKEIDDLKGRLHRVEKRRDSYATFIMLIRSFFILLPVAIIFTFRTIASTGKDEKRKRPISVTVLAVVLFAINLLLLGLLVAVLIVDGKDALGPAPYLGSIFGVSFMLFMLVLSYHLFKMKLWSANLFLCMVFTLFFFLAKASFYGNSGFDIDIVDFSKIFAVIGGVSSVGVFMNYKKFT